jgi:hypothetical protein
MNVGCNEEKLGEVACCGALCSGKRFGQSYDDFTFVSLLLQRMEIYAEIRFLLGRR